MTPVQTTAKGLEKTKEDLRQELPDANAV